MDSHNTSGLNSATSVQTSQEQVTYTAITFLAFYPRKYSGIYLSIEIVIPWCLPTGQYFLSGCEKPGPHKR